MIKEKSNEPEKICKLVNDRFNWALYVDGMEIRFDGHGNADYFAEHYKNLGYKIEHENRY